MTQPETSLEDRVARLEAILAKAIERAQRHPMGRQILRLLGLANEG